MYKSIIFLLLIYCPLCFAIALKPEQQSEVMLWIENYHLQTPAMDIDKRDGFSISYKKDWCLNIFDPFCLGIMAKFESLTDPHQKTSQIDVRQDFYHLVLPFKLSYSKFLRFSLLAGPGYSKSN